METITLKQDDIQVSITKTERVEGMTWTEIAKVFTSCLRGLGYNPVSLENLIEEREEEK